jgi:aldehyde dehydrogenase (NAD+)
VLTHENGKTLAESRVEIDAAIRECEYQLAEGVRLVGQTVPVTIAGTLAYSRREPLGVAAIIAPWNFPFNVPVRKGIPALMAGNTVVFKPASLTPRTGLLLTELMIAAGLPAGVWNCVTGGGRAVGETLVTDPRVKAISFTGSTAVGRRIHELAARNFTRTQLELGGKNPTVVLEDADLEAAVAATVRAAYACAGQWCTSTSRAVVVAPIAEAFTERLLEQVGALRVGPGDQPGTDMGPVCGEAQQRDILAYIARGQAEGARLRCGGHALTGPGYDGGCFIAPTVFDQVTPAMTIAQEEIFGPVLVIQVVPDFAAAVAVANGVRYGLSSSIFTRDLGRALTFMEQTEAGLTHVNLLTSLKEPQLVFGGIKESGVGIPEAGHDGLTFFTEHKVAYVKYR